MNGSDSGDDLETKWWRGRPTGRCGEELWVLIPVKMLEDAKQRLRGSLGADTERLAVAMFKDVLAALAHARSATRVVVVTADPQVAEIAGQGGALVVGEKPPFGMISAIELGVSTIRKRGGKWIVILPADVPLLTGREFDRIAGEFEHEIQNEDYDAVGISPSADEGGTNCLFVNTQRVISLRYGPDSFRLHCESAVENGHRPIRLHSPTISMDVDEQPDLDALLAFCDRNPEFQQTETWQLLYNTGRAV